MDVRGANSDPFHVIGYYVVTGMKWKVTKCITRNAGRTVYVPVEKGTKRKKDTGKGKGKETIPPLAVADLAPPLPNETVDDTFDDLGMLEEEGNPDKVDLGQGIAIKGKKNARRIKLPIKTKWIVPLVLSALSATPNLPSKEITELLKPYIIDMFLASALIQKVQKSVRDQVFGDPDNNATYVQALQELLENGQHDLDIYVKTPMEVKKHLLSVVLEQKINSVKNDNKKMVEAKKLH